MHRIKFHSLIFLPAFLLLIWTSCASFSTVVLAQDTQASPTPQASQNGIFITVLGDEPFANVRVGPSASIYAVIGKLLPGDTAPALGRSPGGDWIQIEYAGAPNGGKGWVYAPLVALSPGTLQIAEPPPTPIPPATSTIDPTLAAQFSILPTNTRLPTFTPPAPINTLAFTQTEVSDKSNSVPVAIIILSLAGFGVIGFVLSLLLPRRTYL